MNKSCPNVKVSKVGTAEKKKERKVKEKKKDRLSKLPDELLHRILSFVDTLSAVQMSVLSKRWENVWTTLPVLNFDSSIFSDVFSFQCFIDEFMSYRDDSTNVYALNFVCNDDLDDGHIVDSIIDHVTSTPTICDAVRALSIIAECVAGSLPQLSLCRSLTTLKLADIAAEITTFDIVSLEKLFLFGCRFECGEEDELDLFKGCVNLKSLFLHDCQYYGSISCFTIFAPHLTELSVERFRVDEEFDSDCVFELFTPKLQSFSYCDSDLYEFDIEEDLCFVEKLDIDVMDCLSADDSFSLRLIELFEEMGTAKFISLSIDIIRALSMFPDLLNGRSPPFTGVKSFALQMDRPSSYVMPRNVMAYLFGESRGFNLVAWAGSRQ